MERGDISNKRGPAIAINADVIMELEKKFFGLRKKLTFMLSSRHQLETYFIEGDLSIYIVCTGELAKRKDDIQDMLDTFVTPYTDILVIESADEMNYFLSAKHILGYFYKNETPVNIRTSKSKYYQVDNVSEIDFYLNGGLRK